MRLSSGALSQLLAILVFFAIVVFSSAEARDDKTIAARTHHETRGYDLRGSKVSTSLAAATENVGNTIRNERGDEVLVENGVIDESAYKLYSRVTVPVSDEEYEARKANGTLLVREIIHSDHGHHSSGNSSQSTPAEEGKILRTVTFVRKSHPEGEEDISAKSMKAEGMGNVRRTGSAVSPQYISSGSTVKFFFMNAMGGVSGYTSSSFYLTYGTSSYSTYTSSTLSPDGYTELSVTSTSSYSCTTLYYYVYYSSGTALASGYTYLCGYSSAIIIVAPYSTYFSYPAVATYYSTSGSFKSGVVYLNYDMSYTYRYSSWSSGFPGGYESNNLVYFDGSVYYLSSYSTDVSTSQVAYSCTSTTSTNCYSHVPTSSSYLNNGAIYFLVQTTDSFKGFSSSSSYSSSGSSSSDSSSSSCFAGSETVLLESGAYKSIADVRVGDRILAAADASGKDAIFSDVVYVPHAANNYPTSYVHLVTASGRDIKMTPSHILPAGDCTAPAAADFSNLLMASQVSVGQCVTVIDIGNSFAAVKEQVVSVSNIAGEGVYSVVTEKQFIVVNGIVASPFGYIHWVPHAYYSLHRWIYRFVGKSGISCLVPAIEYANSMAAMVADTYLKLFKN
jgi:hypothetical protein